jgi:hypothetical protein
LPQKDKALKLSNGKRKREDLSNQTRLVDGFHASLHTWSC